MAYAPLWMQMASVGMQMYGQHQAGKEAEAAEKRQRAWHEYSAQLAEREAREAQEAAAIEERKHRKGGERLKARQRALYAKAGVTFEGSPLEKMEETERELEEDALRIRRGGLVGYRRYTAEASLERMAGRSALLRGRAARKAAKWQMASTAVGSFQYGSM